MIFNMKREVKILPFTEEFNIDAHLKYKYLVKYIMEKNATYTTENNYLKFKFVQY